jgi:hypothetical protein
MSEQSQNKIEIIKRQIELYEQDMMSIEPALVRDLIAPITSHLAKQSPSKPFSLANMIEKMLKSKKSNLSINIESGLNTPPQPENTPAKKLRNVRSLKDTEEQIYAKLAKLGLVELTKDRKKNVTTNVNALEGPYKELTEHFLNEMQEYRSKLTSKLKDSAKLSVVLEEQSKREMLNLVVPSAVSVSREAKQQHIATNINSIKFPANISPLDYTTLGGWVNSYMFGKLGENYMDISQRTAENINTALVDYATTIQEIEKKYGKNRKFVPAAFAAISRAVGQGIDIKDLINSNSVLLKEGKIIFDFKPVLKPLEVAKTPEEAKNMPTTGMKHDAVKLKSSKEPLRDSSAAQIDLIKELVLKNNVVLKETIQQPSKNANASTRGTVRSYVKKISEGIRGMLFHQSGSYDVNPPKTNVKSSTPPLVDSTAVTQPTKPPPTHGISSENIRDARKRLHPVRDR